MIPKSSTHYFNLKGRIRKVITIEVNRIDKLLRIKLLKEVNNEQKVREKPEKKT